MLRANNNASRPLAAKLDAGVSRRLLRGCGGSAIHLEVLGGEARGEGAEASVEGGGAGRRASAPLLSA